MDTVLASWLVVLALVMGAVMGGKAFNSSWADDCQKLGMHRDADSVYKCEKVK